MKNGDIIGTRASNNWMSRMHSYILGTPIAHVGIAIVEEHGDQDGKVYLFESGAPRGAQLRDLDDYMQEGADCLWWRSLDVKEETRRRIVSEIEKSSTLAYSWAFLKRLPFEVSGLDAPGQSQEEDDNTYSCGDLIASVYIRSGILAPHARQVWFPMHFLEDLKLEEGLLTEPVNIIFSGLQDSSQRWYRSIERLSKAINELV